MDAPPPSTVECETVHPVFHVPDVAAAAAYYAEKLGFTIGFDAGDFAGVNFGRVQVFLEKGPPGTVPAAAYFVVDDADALLAHHRAHGVEVDEEIGDRPWGLRDYAIRDPWGHRLGFGHHIFNTGPPIEIERVDVPVRLEKRLAALLADLAAHNRVSVSSALEEILLHTNDGVGPHTPRTLAYIQQLKAKHGIDYDTHGSYRFRER